MLTSPSSLRLPRCRRRQEQTVQQHVGHSCGLAAGVPGIGVGEPAEGMDEVLCADVAADGAGLGSGVQHALHLRREHAEELGRQWLIGRVAGVQRTGEAALGGDKAGERL